ncbi:transposase [Paeniroseomonas aquatica]|uniref:transposase n=1 Tax=Paeniroseomonas aquatica TaxID=373043 RepID=UPI0036194F87
MRETSTPTPPLTDDPAALHALLLAAWAKWDDAVAECDALAARNERLQHLLRKLQRMQFGRRSEQLTADQLQFAFAEVEASIADTTTAISNTFRDGIRPSLTLLGPISVSIIDELHSYRSVRGRCEATASSICPFSMEGEAKSVGFVPRLRTDCWR